MAFSDVAFKATTSFLGLSTVVATCWMSVSIVSGLVMGPKVSALLASTLLFSIVSHLRCLLSFCVIMNQVRSKYIAAAVSELTGGFLLCSLAPQIHRTGPQSGRNSMYCSRVAMPPCISKSVGGRQPHLVPAVQALASRAASVGCPGPPVYSSLEACKAACTVRLSG